MFADGDAMSAKETRVCNVCKRELPIARFQRIALWKGGPTVLTACDGCRKPRAKRKQPLTAKTERMINREQPTIHLIIVEDADSCFSTLYIAILTETKSFRRACVFISLDPQRNHRPCGLKHLLLTRNFTAQDRS